MLNKIIEKDKQSFKGMLQGLKSFIDGELRKGLMPENAMKLYEEQIKNYKQKYATITS